MLSVGRAQAARPCQGPSTSSPRSSVVAHASARRVSAPRVALRRGQLRTRSAEEGAAPVAEEGGAAPPLMEEMEMSRDDRGPRRSGPQQDTPEFTHFLPLPKPAHLIYIKPTVAVVAGMSSRNSVGLKMSAGDDKLERYIIEFYSKSVK